MSKAADQPREFYERYVEEHVPYHRSPRGLKRLILSVLPYWSYLEWRFWRRSVPSGSRVLDLGCARGREVFREQGAFVVGMDLASNALRECLENYDGGVEASLTALPVADHSFDCVVSSHVLGHVAHSDKDQVLSEIHRVLRPGGVSLHVIETDSKCWLMDEAKQHPDLYDQHLIKEDGHVGLELATEALARFERAGLVVESVAVLADGDLHPRLAMKWFANDYAERSDGLAVLVAKSRKILANPIRLAWHEMRLGFRHRDHSDRSRLDNALFVTVALRKH